MMHHPLQHMLLIPFERLHLFYDIFWHCRIYCINSTMYIIRGELGKFEIAFGGTILTTLIES